MSKKKLIIHSTDTLNLISNLRGEVGEIIFTWILLRDAIVIFNEYKSSDIRDDIMNPRLCRLNILRDKLSDEIVARLSELAERKIAQLTFYFAGQKLQAFDQEIESYINFINKNRFREKRNQDISHKSLPEKWENYSDINIPYRTILKGIAQALRLMKKIDNFHLGTPSKYLWHEMRKKRYKPFYPVKISYIIMPHFKLSEKDRIRIIETEIEKGILIWEDLDTIVNGNKTKVKACKEWGIIQINGKLLVLDNYPLELITFTILNDII